MITIFVHALAAFFVWLALMLGERDDHSTGYPALACLVTAAVLWSTV